MQAGDLSERPYCLAGSARGGYARAARGA